MTTPIPGPSGVREIARAGRALTSDPCPMLDELNARYGATFQVKVGPIRLVVVSDTRDLTDMFATPVESFRWGFPGHPLKFVAGPTSMIVSDGDDNRRRRGYANPGFARRRLDAWIPMILAETDRLCAESLLAEQGPFPFFDHGRTLVRRIVVTAMFGAGLSGRADEIGALIDVAKVYIEQSAARQLPHPIPYTRRWRWKQARAELDGILDEEIARRRAGSRNTDGSDLLDALLAEDLPAAEVRDQVVTLIAAGYDTTASQLAWTVLRAAGDPDVWARLRSEADAVGLSGTTPLGDLPYAGAVVKEALRLHPVGVFSPRMATQDVALGDHVVPKNALIMWSPYLAGRDPEVWDEPLAFRPERHLSPVDDPARAAAMDAAWVPFGKGPRKCIGFGLAQMELTLILSRLAQALDVTLAGPVDAKPYGMIVNRPTGGVPVRVTSRPSR